MINYLPIHEVSKAFPKAYGDVMVAFRKKTDDELVVARDALQNALLHIDATQYPESFHFYFALVSIAQHFIRLREAFRKTAHNWSAI